MDVNTVASSEMGNQPSSSGISRIEQGTAMTRSVSAPDNANNVSSSSVAQKNGNQEPTTEQLKQMISNMQSDLDSMNINLEYFLYGEKENKVAVKVVDKESGEVIREIPPKEIQALQEKMSELVGMIFNKEA